MFIAVWSGLNGLGSLFNHIILNSDVNIFDLSAQSLLSKLKGLVLQGI